MITVSQVNRDFGGDLGKLLHRSVSTPLGEGKIRAVGSERQRGTFGAYVQFGTSRKRHYFTNDQLEIA
jgi:hypothetical protein